MRVSAPILRIAWRNVRKNARHSLGSILAIAVGFVAIAVADGYLTFIARDTVASIGDRFMMNHLIVERPGAGEARHSGRPFDEYVLREREQAFLDGYLAAHAGEVEAHGRTLYVWGLASTGKASTQYVGYGYDVAQGARLRGRYAWDVLAGKPLQLAGESSVVLARGLADLLDCQPASDRPWYGKDGRPIEEERPLACRRPRVQLVASTATGQLNVVEPEIVGIIDGGLADMDAKLLAMPLPLAQRLLDTRAVSYYTVRLRRPSHAAAFSRDLARAARAEGLALVAMPWTEHTSGEEHRRAMQVLDAYRALVAAVVVLIAAMSVLTTMAKAVSERTREIGTLRALGFVRGEVVRMFAIEAALLAGFGTALGAIASIAVTVLVSHAGLTYDAGLMAQPMPLEVAFVPSTYVLAAALLSALSALAAIVPARRAALRRIPDALAHA